VDADIFLGDVLPAAAGWSALLGARVLSRVGSPVLRFRCDTWDDLVATWSSKLRGEARRNERKLAREHDLGFRFTENPEQLAADLEILFALHRARWGRSAFAAREPFHRDFARRALEQGWLRLCFLMADGEAVAATYGFQYGGAWFYYQSGWAARWASYSVGRVLLIHTIREAIESGAREYRFLLGGEGYKYRYARDDAGVETIAVARRPAGRIAVAAMAEFRRRADARNPDAPPPATPA
jgi:CelD/BcsL family acetyltransferase involved in cellulose biosynthesis